VAVDLVTAEEARAQIRLDPPDSNQDPDSLWLSMWIPIVSMQVTTWLKDEWRLFVPLIDSNGDPLRDSNDDPIPTDVVHPAVKGACLYELATAYRFREGEGENTVPDAAGYGYVLSRGATAILAALRKSTVR
jgi:hypothetical protein